MAGGPYERLLAAEMLTVMGAETLDSLSGASTGSFNLPDPSRSFATVVVFMMLSGVAMFGEKAGKLAAQFGGVAALGMLMTPSKVTGRAPVAGMLAYFSQMIGGGGGQTPQAGTTVGSSGQAVPITTPGVAAGAGANPGLGGNSYTVNPNGTITETPG